MRSKLRRWWFSASLGGPKENRLSAGAQKGRTRGRVQANDDSNSRKTAALLVFETGGVVRDQKERGLAWVRLKAVPTRDLEEDEFYQLYGIA